MHPYYQTLGHKAAETRQAELLNTIRDYRYLAGYKLAADGMRERALTERALCRRLAAHGARPARRPVVAGMRRRLGEALVGLGTRLQGGSLEALPVASPAGSRAAV